jgi:hypothetical protein
MPAEPVPPRDALVRDSGLGAGKGPRRVELPPPRPPRPPQSPEGTKARGEWSSGWRRAARRREGGGGGRRGKGRVRSRSSGLLVLYFRTHEHEHSAQYRPLYHLVPQDSQALAGACLVPKLQTSNSGEIYNSPTHSNSRCWSRYWLCTCPHALSPVSPAPPPLACGRRCSQPLKLPSYSIFGVAQQRSHEQLLSFNNTHLACISNTLWQQLSFTCRLPLCTAYRFPMKWDLVSTIRPLISTTGPESMSSQYSYQTVNPQRVPLPSALGICASSHYSFNGARLVVSVVTVVSVVSVVTVVNAVSVARGCTKDAPPPVRYSDWFQRLKTLRLRSRRLHQHQASVKGGC